MCSSNGANEIWFVYDGECPLCNQAALAFRLREEFGELHLLSARESADHWLIQEITGRGYDLDEGMVIYVEEGFHEGPRFYHGKDALRFMAQFGERRGLVNRISFGLFQSERIAKHSYPLLRVIRNLLLKVKGAEPIGNLSDKSLD